MKPWSCKQQDMSMIIFQTEVFAPSGLSAGGFRPVNAITEHKHPSCHLELKSAESTFLFFLSWRCFNTNKAKKRNTSTHRAFSQNKLSMWCLTGRMRTARTQTNMKSTHWHCRMWVHVRPVRQRRCCFFLCMFGRRRSGVTGASGDDEAEQESTQHLWLWLTRKTKMQLCVHANDLQPSTHPNTHTHTHTWNSLHM